MNKREVPFPTHCYATPQSAAARPQLVVSHPKRPKVSDEELKRKKLEEVRQHQAVDRAAELLDRLEARSQIYAAQIKALQRRKQLAEARFERIKDRALAEMECAAISEAPGYHRWLRSKPAPAALDVTDESLIPEEYWRVKEVRNVDRMAAKAALLSGADVPGCSLSQKLTLLRE